jgi:hypothetical protein
MPLLSIDIYPDSKRTGKPRHHGLDISLFPQLMAGPSYAIMTATNSSRAARDASRASQAESSALTTVRGKSAHRHTLALPHRPDLLAAHRQATQGSHVRRAVNSCALLRLLRYSDMPSLAIMFASTSWRTSTTPTTPSSRSCEALAHFADDLFPRLPLFPARGNKS